MINMLISRLSFRFSIEGLKILTNKNSRAGRHMSHSRCCAARLRLLLYAQREFKGPRARRRNRPLAHYVPHIPFSLLPFIGFYCLFLLSLPSERGVPPSSLFIAHFPSLGDRRSCLWGENRFRHTARARARCFGERPSQSRFDPLRLFHRTISRRTCTQRIISSGFSTRHGNAKERRK